jgi:hypothetical protein
VARTSQDSKATAWRDGSAAVRSRCEYPVACRQGSDRASASARRPPSCVGLRRDFPIAMSASGPGRSTNGPIPTQSSRAISSPGAA